MIYCDDLSITVECCSKNMGVNVAGETLCHCGVSSFLFGNGKGVRGALLFEYCYCTLRWFIDYCECCAENVGVIQMDKTQCHCDVSNFLFTRRKGLAGFPFIKALLRCIVMIYWLLRSFVWGMIWRVRIWEIMRWYMTLY